MTSEVQTRLALVMEVATQKAEKERLRLIVEGLEAQLALTKMLYAKDLQEISAELDDHNIPGAQEIISQRLNDARTEIDITDDDVADAIRAFSAQSGSKE